jgi:hypothetical protein
MEGLDTIRGCASRPGEGLFSQGFLFICALVFGSLGSALLAGDFEFEWPSPSGALLALLGGVFLGWGAMVSFGCIIGTLLSGVHVSSLSGCKPPDKNEAPRVSLKPLLVAFPPDPPRLRSTWKASVRLAYRD